MLKILKISLEFEIKGDKDDKDDLKERVGDYLMQAIEDDSLSFYADDSEDEDE